LGADPHEAIGEHVQEKPTEELLARERHLALPVVVRFSAGIYWAKSPRNSRNGRGSQETAANFS
jgi:hypothetical protein